MTKVRKSRLLNKRVAPTAYICRVDMNLFTLTFNPDTKWHSLQEVIPARR